MSSKKKDLLSPEMILLIIGLVGILSLFGFLSEALPILETNGWKSTPCRILESTVVAIENSDNPKERYQASIRYEYNAGDQTYESTRIYPVEENHSTEPRASVAVQEHSLGMETVCYVDPVDPKNAVLKKRSVWLLALGIVPLLLLSVGFGGFLLLRFPKLASAIPSLRIDWIMAIPVAFILAGIVPFFFMTVIPSVKYLGIKQWQATPCEITDSTTITIPGRSNRATFRPQIRYRYSVAATQHTGERIELIDSNLSQEESEALVLKFPKGLSATCYVNPDQPSEAVLNPEYPFVAKIGYALLIFPLVGLLIAWIIRPRKN